MTDHLRHRVGRIAAFVSLDHRREVAASREFPRSLHRGKCCQVLWRGIRIKKRRDALSVHGLQRHLRGRDVLLGVGLGTRSEYTA